MRHVMYRRSRRVFDVDRMKRELKTIEAKLEVLEGQEYPLESIEANIRMQFLRLELIEERDELKDGISHHSRKPPVRKVKAKAK